MSYLRTRDDEEVLVVYFNEQRILDQSIIQQIGKELEEIALAASADKKLVINFDNVQFMSSSMIGQIVTLNKRCKQWKIKLKLCSISPNIMEVFKITRLTKILDIFDDEEAALETFGKRGWFK